MLVNVKLDEAGLGRTVEKSLEQLMDKIADSPEDSLLMDQLDQLTEVIDKLPFHIELSRVQNIFFEIYKEIGCDMHRRAQSEIPDAVKWLNSAMTAGSKLGVRTGE